MEKIITCYEPHIEAWKFNFKDHLCFYDDLGSLEIFEGVEPCEGENIWVKLSDNGHDFVLDTDEYIPLADPDFNGIHDKQERLQALLDFANSEELEEFLEQNGFDSFR